MTFVTRLLDKFRAASSKAENTAEDDVFTLRLRKMQGRARMAPRHSAFKNLRLHPAA